MKTIIMSYPNDNNGKDEVFNEMKEELIRRSDYDLEIVNDIKEIHKRMEMNVRVCCVIYDWDKGGMQIPHAVSSINDNLPVFAFSLTQTVRDLDISDLLLNLHFLDYVAYSAVNNIDRIDKAIQEYYDEIMPPFTKILFDYTKENKYPYCTPGHLGGSAFCKSPVGAIFYDFYGANIFKADISVSMPELGSLLDHTGPHHEAEEYIAKTFNADRSFIVTNGTSSANKIIGMGAVAQGDTVLIDRNCHKSLTHLLMMTDVKPLYLKPTRNAYGIIGGIPKSEFKKEVIDQKIKDANTLAEKNGQPKNSFSWPTYAVITNSTYDGLLYKTEHIKKNLDIKHIHFDSAWVPYCHFSPIYKGLYGMHGEPTQGKIIYESHSTHKLLAAFSQTSMVHIKGEFDEHVMNESFMMHSSTSPQYALVASAEMAAAMMKGNSGKKLIESSQHRAMNFRHEIKKLNLQNKEGWFFDIWQPDDIGDTAACWPLNPDETWHLFPEADNNHIYLDPIKITLLTPGLQNGELNDFGIPASIVAKYLDYHGIVVEKTGAYSILFLYSIGIDKAKSLKLLSSLMEFKREFDENETIEKMLPNLYKIDPVFYRNMKIQTLAKGIHEVYKKYQLPKAVFNAYNTLPLQQLTPYQAYQQLVKGNVENCKLKDIKNQVCAEMILPYPPGIPVILPGEVVTEECSSILEFLLALCEIGEEFTGFETDIHGAWKGEDGEYLTQIIKQP